MNCNVSLEAELTTKKNNTAHRVTTDALKFCRDCLQWHSDCMVYCWFPDDYLHDNVNCRFKCYADLNKWDYKCRACCV